MLSLVCIALAYVYFLCLLTSCVLGFIDGYSDLADGYWDTRWKIIFFPYGFCCLISSWLSKPTGLK